MPPQVISSTGPAPRTWYCRVARAQGGGVCRRGPWHRIDSSHARWSEPRGRSRHEDVVEPILAESPSSRHDLASSRKDLVVRPAHSPIRLTARGRGGRGLRTIGRGREEPGEPCVSIGSGGVAVWRLRPTAITLSTPREERVARASCPRVRAPVMPAGRVGALARSHGRRNLSSPAVLGFPQDVHH